MSSENHMNAVILAAGIGSRLSPITDTKPKCLVHVNGKPIIDYQIDALLSAGITSIFIVAGYRHDDLRRHLERVYAHSSSITMVVNEDYLTTNNMYSLHTVRSQVQDS